MGSKRGQVWIETVIYLLIGLAVIGILLSFIKPKIDSSIDKTTIEKSIQVLSELDDVISDVRYISGNSRQVGLGIKKGTLMINSYEDKIIFLIEDSNYEYSEIGREVEVSGTRVKVITNDNSGRIDVALSIDYGGELNITYSGSETTHTLNPASTPYSLGITNLGAPVTNSPIQIDFKAT